jgi:hypothetical protein
MKHLKEIEPSTLQHPSGSVEQRRTDRTPVSFRLMYSGIYKEQVLIGDGTVTDLSRHGLGIRGNHPVKVGLELTIFLYFPDGNDPLFVLEGNVVWSAGNRFGVEFTQLNLREEHRLLAFLRARSARPSRPTSH